MKIFLFAILVIGAAAFAQEREICGQVVAVGVRQDNSGAAVKLVTAKDERVTLDIPSSRYLYSSIVSHATHALTDRLVLCAIVQGKSVISAQIGR